MCLDEDSGNNECLIEIIASFDFYKEDVSGYKYTGGDIMSYKVHRFEVGKAIDEVALEQFLNSLRGEVISIVPNITPRFHMMGATARFDYLIVVEKVRP